MADIKRKMPRDFSEKDALKNLPQGIRHVRTIEDHDNTVFGIAFDSSGDILASGGTSKEVKIWEVMSGKLLRTFEGHTGPVNSVAFNSPSTLLASGSKDGTVKIWTLSDGHLRHIFDDKKKECSITRVAFVQKRKILVIGYSGGRIKLIDIDNGDPILDEDMMWSHAHPNSIATNHSGDTIALGLTLGYLEFWKLPEFKITAHQNPIPALLVV